MTTGRVTRGQRAALLILGAAAALLSVLALQGWAREAVPFWLWTSDDPQVRRWARRLLEEIGTHPTVDRLLSWVESTGCSYYSEIEVLGVDGRCRTVMSVRCLCGHVLDLPVKPALGDRARSLALLKRRIASPEGSVSGHARAVYEKVAGPVPASPPGPPTSGGPPAPR
jgi:hypothetical protein